MAEWMIRGVPRALATDLWWMEEAGDASDRPAARPSLRGLEGTGGRGLALLALVVLADLLFYGYAPGLSLALFAGAVLAAAMILSPGRDRLRPALFLAVAALPVLEHVQALSLGFLAVGLVVSLVWATNGTRSLAPRALRLLRDLPLRGLIDGVGLGRQVAQSGLVTEHRRHLRSWAFPAGGGLVLGGLLLQANPVLDQALGRLFSFDGSGASLGRPIFWAGAALLIWPLIAAPRAGVAGTPVLPRLPGPNALSVARGLVLFNLILGVQTVMDAVYLWGGADLPEGMTAAEYAHRGAYPLLVTALLAGGFALAARPFAAEDRRLRMLLLLWLAQNVALTVSALLRLELYVEAFGLTYLRLHSAIWMALVAAGLGLTAWQVWRALPNGWLLIRSAGLAVGVLYAACFVNFAALIAAENLRREKYDGAYVCSLGPTALAAIWASGREVRVPYGYGGGSAACQISPPQIDGWRDWGFRDWRVRRYLEGVAEGVHEDPRGG
jgi:hypothetical protein